MTNDFKFLDELYIELCKNKKLMKLLGNPRTAQARNERIRRSQAPLDFISDKNMNFISIHFSSSTETENYYVVRGFLHVDYYAKSREDVIEMANEVREILAKQGHRRSSSYDDGAIAKGVIHYRDTFRPLLRNDY